MALVKHTGHCHCGRVRFECDAPEEVTVCDCNCSICSMKRNTHFIVPASQFRLLQGEDDLTDYRFGTGTAHHLFCKHCGICSFYRPRSNPEAYAITIHCLDPGTIKHVTVKQFDGQHWEEAHESTRINKS